MLFVLCHLHILRYIDSLQGSLINRTSFSIPNRPVVCVTSREMFSHRKTISVQLIGIILTILLYHLYGSTVLLFHGAGQVIQVAADVYAC